MNDYARSLARRLLETPAILPRRASRFEPERNGLAAEEVESFVEVTAADRASTGRSVERRNAARLSIAAAGDGRLRSTPPGANHPAEPSLPGARDEALSNVAGLAGSTTAGGRVESMRSAVPAVGESLGIFDSRAAPLPPGPDEPAVAASPGSAVVAPLDDAIESAGDRQVEAASPPDGARSLRPHPAKAVLSNARRIATARLVDAPDRIREPLGEAPTPEAVLSITEKAGGDTSTGPSLELDTKPRFGLIQSVPAEPAASVRATVPGSSLDPRGDRPIRQQAEAEPTIEVHIGRIEVKPMTPSPPAAPSPRPRIPAMTLDEYRRKRQERRP